MAAGTQGRIPQRRIRSDTEKKSPRLTPQQYSDGGLWVSIYEIHWRQGHVCQVLQHALFPGTGDTEGSARELDISKCQHLMLDGRRFLIFLSARGSSGSTPVACVSCPGSENRACRLTFQTQSGQKRPARAP